MPIPLFCTANHFHRCLSCTNNYLPGITCSCNTCSADWLGCATRIQAARISGKSCIKSCLTWSGPPRKPQNMNYAWICGGMISLWSVLINDNDKDFLYIIKKNVMAKHIIYLEKTRQIVLQHPQMASATTTLLCFHVFPLVDTECWEPREMERYRGTEATKQPSHA